MHLAQNNASLLAADGKGDRSLLGRRSRDKSEVLLADLSSFHLERKARGGKRGAGGQDDTARFSVKTVDGAEDVRGIPVPIGKGVGECVRQVAVGGVRRHVAAFVADGDRRILI